MTNIRMENVSLEQGTRVFKIESSKLNKQSLQVGNLIFENGFFRSGSGIAEFSFCKLIEFLDFRIESSEVENSILFLQKGGWVSQKEQVSSLQLLVEKNLVLEKNNFTWSQVFSVADGFPLQLKQLRIKENEFDFSEESGNG